MAEQTNYASGFGLSLIITLLFNALLVVVKESSKPLMSWMAAVSGHHWTTHGITIIVVFVVLGFIFSKIQSQEKPWLDDKGIAKGTIAAVIISYLVICGFYLIVG